MRTSGALTLPPATDSSCLPSCTPSPCSHATWTARRPLTPTDCGCACARRSIRSARLLLPAAEPCAIRKSSSTRAAVCKCNRAAPRCVCKRMFVPVASGFSSKYIYIHDRLYIFARRRRRTRGRGGSVASVRSARESQTVKGRARGIAPVAMRLWFGFSRLWLGCMHVHARESARLA